MADPKECLTEQHPQPLLELIDRVTKLQVAQLSEDRIRQIVREEIDAWEKRQVNAARRGGMSQQFEVK